MEITSQMVKDLREQTGLGMMDCKKALTDANGNMEEAVEILRKKGLKVAEKRSGRETSQGIIESYIHTGSKLAVLIELKCETDFVARNEDFKALARDLAMQVAAAAPQWVAPEDVPADIIEKEKAIYAELCKNEGKPDAVIPKIVEGKIKSFYSQVCLLEQPFVKDSDRAVKTVLADAVGKIGENIKIGRFVRLVLGAE